MLQPCTQPPVKQAYNHSAVSVSGKTASSISPVSFTEYGLYPSYLQNANREVTERHNKNPGEPELSRKTITYRLLSQFPASGIRVGSLLDDDKGERIKCIIGDAGDCGRNPEDLAGYPGECS